MGRLIKFCFIILISGAFAFRPLEVGKSENFSVSPGEILNYHVSFGIFSVGEATMEIIDKTFRVNGRSCYKANVTGKTTGLVGWVAKVDDVWGAYVDSANYYPHISYRKIRENNYRKDELVKFDRNTDMIEYQEVDNNTGKFKEPMYFQAPGDVFDIIGGYMHIRSQDMDNMQQGDTLTVPAFFEDTFYELNIMYVGKEQVKTKMGKINCHKMVPIMPDNKLFDGENSISVWFSDDKNKIPVKIDADMFIGHAGIEIESVEGVKHEINMVEK